MHKNTHRGKMRAEFKLGHYPNWRKTRAWPKMFASRNVPALAHWPLRSRVL